MLSRILLHEDRLLAHDDELVGDDLHARIRDIGSTYAKFPEPRYIAVVSAARQGEREPDCKKQRSFSFAPLSLICMHRVTPAEPRPVRNPRQSTSSPRPSPLSRFGPRLNSKANPTRIVRNIPCPRSSFVRRKQLHEPNRHCPGNPRRAKPATRFAMSPAPSGFESNSTAPGSPIPRARSSCTRRAFRRCIIFQPRTFAWTSSSARSTRRTARSRATPATGR